MRVAAIVLFFAVTASAQNAAVDVLHYRIEVDVPDAGDEIAASTEITIRPLAKTASIDLDFGTLAIDEVTVDGEPAKWSRLGERLRIAHPMPDEPFRVRVTYHGAPKDGLFLRANKHGDRGVFADNWPNRAHHWFPAVDHPSDKASVEFTITTPAKFDVVANGTRVEVTQLEGNRKRTRWSEPAQIPVHCMVFGATEFSIVDKGAISYWLYPRDREHGVRELGRTQQMVDLYSSAIGPYPYGKLALVESSTRFGGMENSSAIFFDEKRIDGEGSMESLAAHEIAHQWFGDSVTQRDWPDLWLSEGFATYFASVFFERTDGAEAFAQRMRDARVVYLNANAKEPRPVHDRTITDPFKHLNRFAYEKGAWVLHMLRGMMGDDAFFAAVRDYYAAYRDHNADTAELRVIMERHAGRPLGWFFDEWIYAPGHPVYALAWSWNEGKTAVTIEQKQGGTVFRMPVVVEVRGKDHAQRETVLIDERREQIEIASGEEPVTVVLDPDEWVLKEMAQ